ncbi:ABC transporter ATP-binding protein [Maricaulis sp.]|uniref:ABC transporter ATP-binding protein n=1 Tax=Maricaulis sp. TaxID=1486257 RepID=UPI0025B97FF4|nr:ABC transporter ATP-binding protein [Maricaulis sp.]
MSGFAISATGLRKTFGKGAARVAALKGVDLRLRAGELTLLMGPSGSGKSTLVAALGGLQRPDEGEVLALDEAIWRRKGGALTAFRRRHCGFVFQSVGLFPSLTALEQIMIPLTYIGFDRTAARKLALQALDEVGLAGRETSRPGEMSGGENQRVAIARMIAKEPRLIFCDEPTSSLDRDNGALVAALLHRAAKDHNAMVLCVTHDDRLVPHADRVIEMEDGHLKTDSERTQMS